ncbi:MAG: hypothetical protein CMJ12_03260 [Pelagibacterales bacterium]|nr:hypothetical protein [Pelagibacterales bacterium]PPR17187.1 MAG: hypothetical protein CFH33_00057 [Alphaproteobacteria bacterium MarineAlpha9_Bin3]|tara:strand:+ start:3396 stop:4262 length:867 start_codon:yes stop_codon:yes gene_type:complete
MPLKNTSIKTKVKKINKNKQPLFIIRKKIDKIDNKIHDLLIERAELVKDVINEKRKESNSGIIIYRPAREHEILLRLIKRHKGIISVTSLISIWRKLISTYISIQGLFKVTFAGNIDEIVNHHFGSDIKKIKNKSSISCLNKLANNLCNIAILPFPSKKNDWWIKLTNYSNISVVGSLCDSVSGDIEALVLSTQKIEYASNNISLYTSKITSKNLKKYSDFLTCNGFIIICKKLLTSKSYIILFYTKIYSELENKGKLRIIDSYKFDDNIQTRLVGVFSSIDKEIING